MSESEQKEPQIATQLNAMRRRRVFSPEVRPDLDIEMERRKLEDRTIAQKKLEAEMLCQPAAPMPEITLPKLDDKSILVELYCRMSTTKGVILDLPFPHIVGSANEPGRIFSFTRRMKRLMRDFSDYVIRETHNYADEKEPHNNPAKKERSEPPADRELKKPDVSGLLSQAPPFGEPPIATHEPEGPTSMDEIK